VRHNDFSGLRFFAENHVTLGVAARGAEVTGWVGKTGYAVVRMTESIHASLLMRLRLKWMRLKRDCMRKKC